MTRPAASKGRKPRTWIERRWAVVYTYVLTGEQVIVGESIHRHHMDTLLAARACAQDRVAFIEIREVRARKPLGRTR